jgi:hypothetical protein
MSDFAPVDGRGVWGAANIASAGVRPRGAVEVASPEARASSGARTIVDEVELSDEAMLAQRADRPTREQIVASARERIASGYYDQPGVIDATIERVARDLTA